MKLQLVGSEGEVEVSALALSSPLLDVMPNSHADVKDTWKNVGSDGNII